MMLVGAMIFVLITPFNIFSADPQRPVKPTRRATAPVASPTLPDTIPLTHPVDLPAAVVEDQLSVNPRTDSVTLTPVDTIAIMNAPTLSLFDEGTVVDSVPATAKKVFVPDPMKAVWMSALCPGLGQVYNRRYWKLPIVVGAFMGLGYGASWNNNMLRDYTRGYFDLMDNDPSTNSYMDFFPPNTDESSLNRTWLEQVFKNKKNYFRRNRDLCIISMIGVYLIAVVDAYVDASLTNFDISPDITMQVGPAVIPTSATRYPAVGVQWALNF